MSNLIKYQFVDLHPSDTVKINNNDKKDNFIPLGKDGGISIETIGQQEAEKAKREILSGADTDFYEKKQ